MERSKILKRFWALFLLPPTLLGIWYFPSDLAQSSSSGVLKPWRAVAAMLERETLLWVAVLALSGWIIWTEIRPYVRKRFEAAKAEPTPDIVIHKIVVCRSAKLDIVAPGEVPREHTGKERAIVFYLQISNGSKAGITLRNLKARMKHIHDFIPMNFGNGNEVIDLQKGDLATIRLGYLLTEDCKVGLDDNERLAVHPYALTNLRNVETNGVRSFRFGDQFGYGGEKGNPKYPCYLFVSADDVIPSRALIEIDPWAEDHRDVVTVQPIKS